MFCSRFSIWSRSKDKIELVSSGLASDDSAEKEHPEYSRELETLCEQLQATLEGLVRCRRPAPSVRRRPEGLHTSLRDFVCPSSASSLVSCSACPINLVSEMLS